MDEEDKPVVVDNGSFQIKAGFAEDDITQPRHVFPIVGGRKRINSIIDEKKIDNSEYSDQSIENPIKKGFIENWDDMERIWKDVYKQLRAEPMLRAAIFTEPPLNPKRDREKITKLMFEQFEIPAFYLISSAVSGLYSYGRMTGIAIDSGYESTRCVPIYEGYALTHAIKTCNIGGHDVSLHLLKRLRKEGDYANWCGYTNSKILCKEIDRIRKMKELVCYVPSDYDQELKTDKEQEYELPDGTKMVLNEVIFECGEASFNPKVLGKYDETAVSILINDTINAAIDAYDMGDDDDDGDFNDFKNGLYQNITVMGGNTMLTGFVERLKAEMVHLVGDNNIETKVIGISERKYSSWIGCSILGALSTFEEMYITKEQYDEEGPGIVHKKCT